MAALPQRRATGRRRPARSRRGTEPCLRDILLGTAAFALAVAACLYLVARLAS